MSASYGNYLTEEDPNKKKQEGTTPSMAPTTAAGGTTTPPLPYEGFVGTGTGSNAYQAGVKYAQGVKDSIYGSAEELRRQTDIDTEKARQRGIIDSKSSYQKAIGAYGSNAETLAGRGLSGSGYGEYLTADAYATHRGQVQDINAGALEANRKAANLEAQTKMAADSEYLKNLYSLGANLDTAKDTAYSSIFDAVAKGTSLDVVKQSGGWGDLTPEQQQAITAEAERIANEQSKAKGAENDENYLSLLSDINSGDLTIDAIKNTTMWGTLSGPQQLQLEAAAALKGKTEMKDRMGVYADLAAKGVSLEDIKTMMAINGDKYVEELTPEEYEKLSDEEKAEYDEARNFMKLIESAAEKYTNQNATNETLTNIDNAIADGATLEEIQSMPGYENLDPDVQEQIKEQIEARDEEKEVNIDSVVANLFVPGNEVYSLDDLDTVMRAERVPSEMREEVISRWQSESTDRALAGIAKDIYSVDVELLAEGLKNGVYGDKNTNKDIVEAYYNAAVKAVEDKDATLEDFVDLLKGVSSLPEIGAKESELRTKIAERVHVGSGGETPQYAENGMPIKQGSRITDKTAVGVLEFLFGGTKSGYIKYNNTVFIRNKNGEWFEMVEDSSRGWKPSSDNNSVNTSGSSFNGSSSYEMMDVVIPRNSMGFDQTGAGLTIGGKTYHQRIKTTNATQAELDGAFPNAKEGSVVQKGNVRYALLADGKWYILT